MSTWRKKACGVGWARVRGWSFQQPLPSLSTRPTRCPCCIPFNGIPRTINGLVALRRSLPPAVVDNLPTQARRRLDPQNIQSVGARGNHLFSAVYRSLTRPLVDKLSDAHPDLPIYIVGSHYGALLADPPGDVTVATVGHLLTSIVAVACLRAQTGVEPQLLSHVYGLRKCCEKEAWKTDWVAETGQDETAIPWLMGDDGCEWLLKSVDAIAEALGSSSEPQ
ncbi:hypothetical protein XA68_13435 [Ophiocordyceps unilateralis]|uniref:Uncharacterized protein n=1 Tax=Ophiocordyceps unilateralis TaxID=268505 RepID=A0A2A9PBE9_OPHUN|nr:hypothetical protein XA68_13435 [Ophiocordyceps unilateralis]